MSAHRQFEQAKLNRRQCIVLAAGACAGMQALADDVWPSRPIKLIAPIASGGLTDTLARLVAKNLSDKVGQQVIVDNRPGAGGVIGMTAAARSPADGYNLILVYQGVASVNPVLYKNLPYDTLRDFVPVAGVATFPLAFVVSNQVPADNLQQFIEYARANPSRLSYASAGNATTSHLTMELFKRRTGVHLNHVFYKGEAPALTDLMGGQVDVAFSSLGSILPHLNSGRLRVLGVTSSQRSPIAPQLPTIAESGVSNFQSTGWYGLLAPRATPKHIVERIANAVQTIVVDPQVSKSMLAQALVPNASTPEQLHSLIAEETLRWKKLVAEVGIKVD